MYIFGTLRNYSFTNAAIEREAIGDASLLHITGLSQTYISKISGGLNYIVAITNKRDVYCVDERYEVFRLSTKH